MTKHRTDRTGGEIAAGKAQINYRDLVMALPERPIILDQVFSMLQKTKS